MALEYVGGASASGTNVNLTIPLDALTGGIGTVAQAGDLVVVVTGVAAGTNRDVGVTTAGYTELCDIFANATRGSNLAVAIKKLTSAETSVTTLASANTSTAANAVVHVWRGADDTQPDVTIATATGANSRAADSPAATPATAGSVVLSCGFASASVAMSAAAPSGYENAVSISSDPGIAGIAVIASKAWSGSGAEDPAAWGISGGVSGDSWAAATLVIRPAPTPSSTDVSMEVAELDDVVAATTTVDVLAELLSSEDADLFSGFVNVDLESSLTAEEEADSFSAVVGGAIDDLSDIPGLLWATETPIAFSSTGAIVPPISLSRVAGTPVYCVVAVSTGIDHDAVIFSLSNPATSRWVAQGFTVQRMWETEAWLEVNGSEPGQLKRLYMTAGAGTHEWELFSDSTIGAEWNEWGSAEEITFTNAALGSPDATSELYIGYVPNDGTPALRGSGSITRMRLYDQVPSSANRARLVAWMRGQTGAPAEIVATLDANDGEDSFESAGQVYAEGTLAATGDADELDGEAAVAWPGVDVTTAASDEADSAGAVAAVGVESSLAAADDRAVLSAVATVVWPDLAGVMAVTTEEDEATGTTSVSTSVSFSAQPELDDVTGVMTVAWPSTEVQLAAGSEADVVTAQASVGLEAMIAATPAPDQFVATGALDWSGTTLAAGMTSEIDTASGVATIGIAAAVAALSSPDEATAAVQVGNNAVGAFLPSPDQASGQATVAVTGGLAATSPDDGFFALLGAVFPAVSASLWVSSPVDDVEAVVQTPVLASTALLVDENVIQIVATVDVGTVLSVLDGEDAFGATARFFVPSTRWAYPGGRTNGRLVRSGVSGRLLNGGPSGGLV